MFHAVKAGFMEAIIQRPVIVRDPSAEVEEPEGSPLQPGEKRDR